MNIKQKIVEGLKRLIQKYRILEKWYGIRVETKEFYGQFGEDAALQTFFSNQVWNQGQKVGEIPTGFYVDIGCYSPIRISNTWWFYKRGWNGINVDLSIQTIEAFKKARPRDISIAAAITNSDNEAEIEFFEFGPSSVYNTLDSESAKHTEEITGLKAHVNRIHSLSLRSLFDRNLPEKTEISFLSVDAEGHDLQILQSNNWELYSPKLIVVEVHENDFHKLSQNDVVQFLEEKGYSIHNWLRPSIVFLRNR